MQQQQPAEPQRPQDAQPAQAQAQPEAAKRTRPRINKRRIGLVAHDNKKSQLLDWCKFNRGTLSHHELWGTGTTGAMIERELGLPVHALLSGPVGGDQEVGAMIAENRLDVLVFFWDPLQPQPHDPDVKALLRLATLWNAPYACNPSTADLLISSPLFGSDYQWTRPDVKPRDWGD
ncbi:MAG: methylglyoxal synthase [Bifidobacteriaceae bacterium]|jgi:methylglyoxal synthase|nr:methylglyoxal synthase [Bifidobacteriaceae bacterium]